MYTQNMDGASPTSAANGISKFPAFAPDHAFPSHDQSTFAYPSNSPSRDSGGPFEYDRWQPRRLSRASRPNGSAVYHSSPSRNAHGRQKSLSEAIRTIRTRSGSMSQNAHEIADALKAPVSPQLVVSSSLLPSPPLYHTAEEGIRETDESDRYSAQYGTEPQ